MQMYKNTHISTEKLEENEEADQKEEAVEE